MSPYCITDYGEQRGVQMRWFTGDQQMPPDIDRRAAPGALAQHSVSNESYSGDNGLMHHNDNYSQFSEPELAFRQCPLGAICIETMDSSCLTFEFIISFVIVGCTCAFGFVGNLLSIATLRKDSVKSVTTYLLTWLAIADTAFLIPAVFVIMIPTYCEYFHNCAEPINRALVHLERYGWAVASTMHTCTVYVTVLVAVHRYICVCRPHDARRLSGYRRAKIQIALIPICALIYNLPRLFEYQVTRIWVGEGPNYTMETQKNLTDIGKNVWYQVLYKNVCFYLIMYIIPLGSLSVLSVKLAQTLHRRRQGKCRTQYNKAQHKRDDNITLVLIIIIAVFVVCQTPTLLQRLILAVEGAKGHTCGNIYFYFEQIADYLALLNSCINFVIYVMFARHFRQTLVDQVLCVHMSCVKTEIVSEASPERLVTNGKVNAQIEGVTSTNEGSPIDLSVCSQCQVDKDIEGKVVTGADIEISKPLLEPPSIRYKNNQRERLESAPRDITLTVLVNTGCQKNAAFAADTELDNVKGDSEHSACSFENIPNMDETYV